MKFARLSLFLALVSSFGMAPVAAQTSSFQHVVVVVQENRTPDNLFYSLCAAPELCSTTPTAFQYNIQTSNWINDQSSTGFTQPGEIDLGTNGSTPDNYDLSHAHSAFLDMCDLNTTTNVCAMDGAALIPPACAQGVTGCAPPNPQFMYVNPSDLSF